MGRGFYRSYYKGHKDKIKGWGVEMGEGGGIGWGGVERWGEKADKKNCEDKNFHSGWFFISLSY